jgi:hypothetical protein
VLEEAERHLLYGQIVESTRILLRVFLCRERRKGSIECPKAVESLGGGPRYKGEGVRRIVRDWLLRPFTWDLGLIPELVGHLV